MVVNVVEKIVAESADILLAHHGLVEDSRENVADDCAGVVHRPLDTDELVHLLLAHLRPVPPTDGGPADEARLPLHGEEAWFNLFFVIANLASVLGGKYCE